MTNENPELEKTQKFYPPLEEIVTAVEKKEELKQRVKDSLEGTLQASVEILEMKDIGGGEYEFTFRVSTNGGIEEKKVIVKEPEPLSE